MNAAQSDIEAVVQEVLRRLHDAAGQGPCGTPPARLADPAAGPEIRDRVVSLATLERLPADVRQLIVPPGAVVTPAAKDVLRLRSICLVPHQKSAAQKEQDAGVEIVTTTQDDLETLCGVLAVPSTWVTRQSLEAAIGAMRERVQAGRGRGVVLTEQPATVVCLANRHSGVRAAAANSVLELRAVREELDLNLLVVDLRGRSAYALRPIVREFVQESI